MSVGEEPRRTLGRYVLERSLGSCGSADVHLARDPLLDRPVAIKCPRRGLPVDGELLAEARALAKLSHPSIVSVLDVGAEDGRLFLVLEHLAGPSLADLVDRQGSRLAPERAVELLRGPAEGLDHAHSAGFLHRDLKPENLLAVVDCDLRGRKGPPAELKVTDFGLAALAGSERGSRGLGDPRFVAPEAWRGEADASSDRFALAAIAFWLLAGQPALPGRGPQEWARAAGEPERRRLRDLRPTLPSALDAAFAAVLSPRRHERPETAVGCMELIAGAIASGAERRRQVDEARSRIASKDVRGKRYCDECRLPLSPRAESCPKCGGPASVR
ncbi:MAG: serine/threonine-protein kinase [Acidobacteriota bacterium]